MKTIRQILILLVILACIVTAWYVGQKFSLPGQKTYESSEVVLDKIRSACKLITAEGYFSEVYSHKDYYHWDISLMRKKALIRVKAKVSVGYDLEKMEIKSDELTKTITISNIPGVDIIAIDHDLDYYDISEGAFNAFTADDYNKINDKAKAYIEEVALSSELIQAAERKSNEVFDLLHDVVSQAGWNLVIDRSGLSG